MVLFSANANDDELFPGYSNFAGDDNNITHIVAAICGLSLANGGKSPLLLAPILNQQIRRNRLVPNDEFPTIFCDAVTRLKQLAPNLPNIASANLAQIPENETPPKCLKMSMQIASGSKVDRTVTRAWRKDSAKIFCKESSESNHRHGSICMYSGDFSPSCETKNLTSIDSTEELVQNTTQQPSTSHTVHTIVEFTNLLVPDMVQIVGAPFYWGRMNRHEAEAILSEKSEGTFLLRDSAHLNYLFSVSFRRYNRTLHARIEFQDCKYSFDRNDDGIFSAFSIVELIKHYNDPNRCSCKQFRTRWHTKPTQKRHLLHVCPNFWHLKKQCLTTTQISSQNKTLKRSNKIDSKEQKKCYKMTSNNKNLAACTSHTGTVNILEISRATLTANCVSYASAGKLQLPISLKKYVRELHHKQQLRVMHYDS